jgi:outer membrane biosynthesis protein TonB
VVLRDSMPVLSNTGLPDVVVRRIVRQNFGRLRLCYETAAMADPTLSGTVAVLFRIDTSGAVSSARDAGSTVGSPDLIACVLRTFKLLAFPSPTPGPVEVTETLYFTPRSP